jgi:hypothetical protein
LREITTVPIVSRAAAPLAGQTASLFPLGASPDLGTGGKIL